MDNLNEPQEFDLDDILREFGDHPEENPAEEKDAEPAAPEAPAEDAVLSGVAPLKSSCPVTGSRRRGRKRLLTI